MSLIAALPTTSAAAAGPTVSTPHLSSNTLAPSGGEIAVSAISSRSATCSVQVTPTQPDLPTKPTSCAAGTAVHITIHVVANVTSVPITSKVTVTACVSSDCVTSTATTLTQWANKITLMSEVAPSHAITDASCPTTTFCMVVDASGKAYSVIVVKLRRQQHEYDLSHTSLTSVSCSSPSVCVANDLHGVGYGFDGRVWHTVLVGSAGGTNDSSAVASCRPRHPCVALWSTVGSTSAQNQQRNWNGTTWSPAPNFATPGVVTAISCPSGSLTCEAVDSSGHVTLFGGSTTSSTLLDPKGRALNSVACTSTYCLAGGSSMIGETFEHGDLHRPGAALASPIIGEVCPVTPTCFTVTANSVAIGTFEDRWPAIGDLDYANASASVRLGSSTSDPVITAAPGQSAQFEVFGTNTDVVGYVTLVK